MAHALMPISQLKSSDEVWDDKTAFNCAFDKGNKIAKVERFIPQYDRKLISYTSIRIQSELKIDRSRNPLHLLMGMLRLMMARLPQLDY